MLILIDIIVIATARKKSFAFTFFASLEQPMEVHTAEHIL